MGARLNRGSSRQDYGTPGVFLEAVEKRFGKITFDLAAHSQNAVVKRYFSPEQDSLAQDWNKLDGLLWLNPPFSKIGPWAEKCSQSKRRIVMLVPASVGSNWFRDHVYGCADVFFLNGRITFVGEKHGFPKDCMLCLYDECAIGDCTIWNWRD